MLVGVDFDNTIVCYDALFHEAAVARGLVPAHFSPSKGALRDYLRVSGHTGAWLELQGYVYGSAIQQASPFPGVLQFFQVCRQRGVPLCIISHKSQFPEAGPAYDLRAAAYRWLEAHGFFDPEGIGLSSKHVYFESTPIEKVERVSLAGCCCMIDDLPEFLLEPGIPASVHRILFDPNYIHIHQPLPKGDSWDEIQEMVFARIGGSH